MKKKCWIWVAILLLPSLLPMTAFANEKADNTEYDQVSESTGTVTLAIDDAHSYKGMNKAYKGGYVPTVKDGKATVVLPLISSGKLKGNTITAVPRFGDPASSPFQFKNYQITVKQKDNSISNSSKTVKSYLVSFELPLVQNRINGVYQMTIDVSGKTMDGGEIAQSFETYVIITDGKKPAGDDSVSEKQTSQPKVIVSGYEINPSPVIAGEEFTAKVTLKNTSNEKAVQNMTVDVSCESPNLTLLNDSGTIFIGKLGKGMATEIELKYKTDLETPVQKYSISLSLSYDDPDANSIQSSGVVPLTVQQTMNLRMEPPQIAEQVNAGDTMPISIQVMNLGHSEVYNVRAELSVPGLIPLDVAFIGNMEAGTAGEGKMDVFVGSRDMSEGYEGQEKYGFTDGILTLVYEDADGREYEDEIDISTTINEPVMTVSVQPKEEPETAGQWWVSIIIGAVVIGMLVAFLFINRKKMQKTS